MRGRDKPCCGTPGAKPGRTIPPASGRRRSDARNRRRDRDPAARRRGYGLVGTAVPRSTPRSRSAPDSRGGRRRGTRRRPAGSPEWYTAATPSSSWLRSSAGRCSGSPPGVSTQVIRPDAVWRRRSAEGGIAAMQGLAAGSRRAGARSRRQVAGRAAAAAGAMLAAIAVNTVGRFSIMLERHPGLLLELWPRGTARRPRGDRARRPLLSVLLVADDREHRSRRR